MELRRYEEAITWCDKGLAVSFYSKVILIIQLSKLLLATATDVLICQMDCLSVVDGIYGHRIFSIFSPLAFI